MSIVKFIPETHQYLSEDGRELISVSSFTKQFEKKKDWKKIAKLKSAKLKREEGINISPTELLAEWDRKRLLGSSAGTIVHKIKEDEHFSDINVPIKNGAFIEGIKYSLPIGELENNTVYPELMIYDFDHMICGQSDKVEILNGSINIDDFKTDKSIEYTAYSNPEKFVKPEKLLPPLQHLDNCNFNVYSIKMSLYMYLVWKANKGRFKPGKIRLIWCPIERDEEGIPILYDGIPKIIKEEIIEVPYRKKEVEAMLKTLKNDTKNT